MYCTIYYSREPVGFAAAESASSRGCWKLLTSAGSTIL